VLEKFAKVFHPTELERAKGSADFVSKYAKKEYLALCNTFLFDNKEEKRWDKKGEVWADREDDYGTVKREMKHSLSSRLKSSDQVCQYILKKSVSTGRVSACATQHSPLLRLLSSYQQQQ
jgi:hypothetical protein